MNLIIAAAVLLLEEEYDEDQRELRRLRNVRRREIRQKYSPLDQIPIAQSHRKRKNFY